jgi:hypothetical protein
MLSDAYIRVRQMFQQLLSQIEEAEAGVGESAVEAKQGVFHKWG